MKGWSNSDVPGATSSAPEKRLLAAVLQRAITDFLTTDGELQDSARSWLFEEEVTDAPISFKFICEALDLDQSGLRKAVDYQHKTGTGAFMKEAAV
jgi:hypothetical protein